MSVVAEVTAANERYASGFTKATYPSHRAGSSPS
jgi:hypothetical protein